MKEYKRQKEAEIKEFRVNAAQVEEKLKKRFEKPEKNIVTIRLDAFKSLVLVAASST